MIFAGPIERGNRSEDTEDVRLLRASGLLSDIRRMGVVDGRGAHSRRQGEKIKRKREGENSFLRSLSFVFFGVIHVFAGAFKVSNLLLIYIYIYI